VYENIKSPITHLGLIEYNSNSSAERGLQHWFVDTIAETMDQMDNFLELLSTKIILEHVCSVEIFLWYNWENK